MQRKDEAKADTRQYQMKMHHKDEYTIRKIIRGITGFRGNWEE